MPKYADVNEIKKCLFACTMQELQLGHTADARAFRRAAEIVRTWPAADVAPVRHAHWVKDKRFVKDHYYCSSCDGSALKNNYGEYNILSPYCPECGATMDEEVEEEENRENEQ